MNSRQKTSTTAKLILTTLLGSGLLLGSTGLALADRGHDRHDDNRWEERQQRHERHDHRQTVQARPVHREVVIRDLPRHTRRVHVGKQLYYRDGDRFYSRRAGGFVLVSPPAGVVVARLPIGVIHLEFGGGHYFQSDNVYYRPVRDGYQVIDPVSTGLLRPYTTATVHLEAGLLKVRSGPGETFTAIGMARSGERLQVSGAVPGWYRVSLRDGRSGWVMSRFIRHMTAG